MSKKCKKVEEFYRELAIEAEAEHLNDVIEMHHKLNIANKTIYDLMQENARLREYGIESINKMDDIHERQMKVAESEIKRLNVIINYLETKGL